MIDFDIVRTIFGGKLLQGQVDGINTICEGYERIGGTDKRILAYLLATAFHETARTMQPIHERGAKSYFSKYEPGTKIGKALGNTQPGDGYLYRGRGYVQLTGRANYRKASGKLATDLEAKPENALFPDTAARILIRGCLEGWFTGKKLGDFINAAQTDYINARRVVNGTDRASLIAGYAARFEDALEAYRRAKPAAPVQPQPDTPSQPATSIWAAIIAFILSLLGRSK